mgnify:CR=1 FL=1
MHPQFHAGDVCASSAGVADILKRRLLTLCSDVFETSQLSKASSGLSNDRCPTGYRLSLLCLFWYSICVYAYAHTRTLNYSSTEIIYIRRGLRVVVLSGRQCESLYQWNGNSRTPRFFICLFLKQQSA